MGAAVITTIGQLVDGDQVAERDGYLFTVAIVSRTAKTTTLRLSSDFSPMVEIRRGIVKTFRNSSRVHYVPVTGEIAS